jgi:hypothetical protein
VGYVLFKGIEVYWGFHFRVELRYMKFEAVFYCIITLTNDKKSLADALYKEYSNILAGQVPPRLTPCALF